MERETNPDVLLLETPAGRSDQPEEEPKHSDPPARRSFFDSYPMYLLYAAVGFTQCVLAATVGHGVGVVTGLVATATALPLSLLAAPDRKLPPVLRSTQKSATKLLSSPQTLRAVRVLCKGSVLFAALLTLVRALGSDGMAKGPRLGFPGQCPRGFEVGCARVALTYANGADDLQPLMLSASTEAAERAVRRWVASEPRSTILAEGSTDSAEFSPVVYVHSRHLSFLWGFPDDLWVRLTPQGDGATLVEAQGSLRVGKGDMGVNGKRIGRLWRFLQQV